MKIQSISLHIIMLVHIATLFQLSLSKTITFCQKSQQCTELNDKNFQSKWSNLSLQFNEIQSLEVFELCLSETNYIRLLSHQFPKLKQLSFASWDNGNQRDLGSMSNILTPKIVQTIFTSSYFTRLQVLDLSRTAVQYRHFKFLQNRTQRIISNLKNISFHGQNFLQKKAFKLLSKIDFQGKLIELRLKQNSLVDVQSIDAIIQIIKPKNGGLAQLKNISLYENSITTQNFIRLFDTIDTSTLQQLDISKNAFQHSLEYSIPFNNSVYEYLSTKNFASLRLFALTNLDLDIEQLPYLRNIKLPLIETLLLQVNFITDQYFQQWITKQNMPKLRSLHLDYNALTDKGIENIVKQNFSLIALTIGNNRQLTSNYFNILSKFQKISQIQYLELGENANHDENIKQFFENRQFPKLKKLQMRLNSEAFNLFKYLNWKNMQNLQLLGLDHTDISSSIQTIFQQNITFPKMKNINIGGDWINSQIIMKFINNLKYFAPHAKTVIFNYNQFDSKTRYANISNIIPTNLPDGVYIHFQNMKIRKLPNSSLLQVVKLQLAAAFYQVNFNTSFLSTQQNKTLEVYNYRSDSGKLKKVINYLKQRINFTNIQYFGYDSDQYQENHSDLYVFKQIFFQNLTDDELIQQNKDFITDKKDFKSNLYLPYLKSTGYFYSKQTEKYKQIPLFLYLLNKLQAPVMKTLSIYNQQNKNSVPLINRYIQRNKNIKNILLNNNKLSCDKFNNITQNITLIYLVSLVLSNNQLQIQCLSKFIEKHPLIKVLSVNHNFIQKGLFEVLSNNNIFLQGVDFSQIQIGNQQFQKFALVNFQFTKNILAHAIYVNSEGIKKFVSKVNKTRFFQKLNQLNLQQNNINEEGVKCILGTGIPFLQHFHLPQVQNPNIFNNLCSYPQHLVAFNIYGANLYGINSDLDKRSTRNVRDLFIHSQSLTAKDLKIISETNLLNVKQIWLALRDVQDCEILEPIIKMAQNVKKFTFILYYEKIKIKKLNDKCLAKPQSSITYVKHLEEPDFEIYQQMVYIPNFYAYFYSPNQLVIKLDLQNALIGDQVFINIIQKCNMNKLTTVFMRNNLLTDLSGIKFFKQNYTMLKGLSIIDNQITAESLKYITNVTMPNLKILQISMNPIGDQGLEVLSKIYFPELRDLYLMNCDLSSKGLKKISQFKAPNLKSVVVVNNHINQYQLLKFIKQLPQEILPKLSTFVTNVRVSQSNEIKIKMLIEKRTHKFEIALQSYYIEQKNMAKV